MGMRTFILLLLYTAVITRFFPAAQQIPVLQPSVGNVKLVQASLGQNSNTSQRVMRKQLGGGSVKGRGGYVLQLALEVLGNDMPEKIHAVAQLNNESVDTTASIQLQWNDGRIADLSFLTLAPNWPAVANIYGDEATITIPDPFKRPTTIILTQGATPTQNVSQENYPLPTTIDHRQLLSNGAGMIYEAEEVRRCIRAGLLESTYMTHKTSLTMPAIQDEVLRQIHVSYASLYQNGLFVGSPLEPEYEVPWLYTLVH